MSLDEFQIFTYFHKLNMWKFCIHIQVQENKEVYHFKDKNLKKHNKIQIFISWGVSYNKKLKVLKLKENPWKFLVY